MSRIAVVTPVAGRGAQLRAQERHLAALDNGPDVRVLVAMDDPGVARLAGDMPSAATHIVSVRRGRDGGLPLARARNAGIAAALERGADLIVLLDVDCLPGPTLLTAYAAGANMLGDVPALLCGPVTYLPADAGAPDPEDLPAFTSPHAARPVPPSGELVRGGDHRLFWSLSFAVTPATWERLGGFHEGYDGYGGEDTDLGFTARARGVELAWVGGAHAYHQHHPVSSPPVEHLASILRNAALFHDRWGVWPMEGWLSAFADLGLATYDGETWRVTRAAGVGEAC